MSHKTLLQVLKVSFALAAITIAFAVASDAASKEKVLYAFKGGNDGAFPQSTLIFDGAGNLYGTTPYGGSKACYRGCGTVFKLSPTSNGGWRRAILHEFSGADGAHPLGSLIFDRAGDLYGTTSSGGNGVCNQGCGTVFKLTPTSKGRWKETVLYAFTNSPDGANPGAGLIFDALGNLYGTTAVGGDAGDGGTVFTLTPTSSGWKETVLYSFVYGCGKSQGTCGDGAYPRAGLIFDAKGNLYGTSFVGGTGNCSYNSQDGVGCGTVVELTRSSNGWTEKVLYSFTGGKDGGFPVDSLVMDAALNLYGTSENGGRSCNGGFCGNIFRLTQSGGQWQETVIHNFDGKDGATPQAGLVMNASGDLFGTTSSGTRCCAAPPKRGPCCGTVFELTPAGQGAWKETVLHNFTGGNDGLGPAGGVIFDATGNLYGTTTGGGERGDGVVFRIKRQASSRSSRSY